MFSLLLTPEYAPFTLAFVLMLGIGLIEGIGLGLGHLDLDSDLDGDAGPGLLDWLGLGRGLPLLVWLTSLLACFTVTGFALQQGASQAFGAPLHWGLATAAALAIGALANRFVAAGLARVFPSFESTAIEADDLLRQRGTVLEGAASRGRPARAKVVDQFGQAHYVMIEPHNELDIIGQGETALLVRKEGPVFFALPDASTAFRPI
ncbi:MAG: DUF1449 family protein [Sphingomonadales bacterium]|nr:MAG: DUF1449 family protein [Sphingomonadales bacterium]